MLSHKGTQFSWLQVRYSRFSITQLSNCHKIYQIYLVWALWSNRFRGRSLSGLRLDLLESWKSAKTARPRSLCEITSPVGDGFLFMLHIHIQCLSAIKPQQNMTKMPVMKDRKTHTIYSYHPSMSLQICVEISVQTAFGSTSWKVASFSSMALRSGWSFSSTACEVEGISGIASFVIAPCKKQMNSNELFDPFDCTVELFLTGETWDTSDLQRCAKSPCWAWCNLLRPSGQGRGLWSWRMPITQSKLSSILSTLQLAMLPNPVGHQR